MGGLGTGLENKVNALLGAWVNGVSAQFCTLLAAPAMVAFTIYLILMGWQIMRGEAAEAVNVIAKRLFTMAVIGALGLTFGVYQAYVVAAANAIPNGLVQIIAASPVALTATDANGNPIAFATNGEVLSLGALIDAIQTTFTNLYLLLWANSTTGFVPHFSIIISALLVAVALAAVVLISLGFYLLAKVELALCLAVGPLFILLAIFDATREWTRRWIGQLFHYGVQIGLMAACISMLQGTLIFFANGATNNYNNNGGTSVFADVLVVVLVSLCVCVIVWNIGRLSTALSGAIGAGHAAEVMRAGQFAGSGAIASGRAISGGSAKGWGAMQWTAARLRGAGRNQIAPAPSGTAGRVGGGIPAAQVPVQENL
jgi:type IV secretion system protein VirB6